MSNDRDILKKISEMKWTTVNAVSLRGTSIPDNHALYLLVKADDDCYCITGQSITVGLKSEIFALNVSRKDVVIDDDDFFIQRPLALSEDFLSKPKKVAFVTSPEVENSLPGGITEVSFFNSSIPENVLTILASKDYPTDITVEIGKG